MKKKVYVLVTIDTECDKGAPGWDVAQPLSFKNIALQESLLMPLFKKYGIVPTFLISPEVLVHQNSVDILKNLSGEAELGTHLHTEFIEPNSNFSTTKTNGIQANLNFEEESKKLENLTQLFKDKIGYPPKSFRSGRFGSSKYTTKILASLGYKVDSSVVPFTTKFFDKLNINGWDKHLEPYWENFENDKILQVPVTLINKDIQKIPHFLRKSLGKPQSLSMKVFKKLGLSMDTKWLRPYKESGEGLVDISKFVIQNHFKKQDFAILNLMFHSNEILVNGSPYCESDKEVEEYIDSLEHLFNYICQNYSLCSIGLGEISTIYSQN